MLVIVKDGDFTLSATALFLLRTLERDHTKKSPLFEQLFPCCGRAMYPYKNDVIICGCLYGKDFEIIHQDESIIIRNDKGTDYTVPFEEWKKAVCSFPTKYQHSMTIHHCDNHVTKQRRKDS